MMDVYICSSDADAMNSFCEKFVNVIGPAKGIAATDKQVTEDGIVIPARQGAGDTEKYYACVRAEGNLDAPDGITLISAEEGSAILGVWA